MTIGHVACDVQSASKSASRDISLTDPETGVASGIPEAAICVQDIDVQCVLQFTLIHAASCALHRHTSRVIHRLELYDNVSRSLSPNNSVINDTSPRRGRLEFPATAECGSSLSLATRPATRLGFAKRAQAARARLVSTESLGTGGIPCCDPPTLECERRRTQKNSRAVGQDACRDSFRRRNGARKLTPTRPEYN